MTFLFNRERVSNEKLSLENLTDAQVFATTRLPRATVKELCTLLQDGLKRPTRRSHALEVHTQVLTALEFYSSGSFQWMVGRSTGLTQWQPAVSKVVDGVTQALCKLAKVTITFIPTRSRSPPISYRSSTWVAFQMCWDVLTAPTSESKRRQKPKKCIWTARASIQ